MNEDLIARSLKHLWNPCSQMKDFAIQPPLSIRSAKGCYLELTSGERLIDAIASWWCKSLGHAEPRLQAALIKQMHQFEHVMLGNTTNATIVALSEKLASLTQGLDKVFYAADGSCAVEIAVKMSLHAKQLLGQSQRQTFMALTNSYHGETCLALSLSDLGLYRQPYQSLLTPCYFLTDIPYVTGKDDPLWQDCSTHWDAIERQLNAHCQQLCAIIIEPIVQGAGQMRIYSQDFLQRLSRWAKQHDVYLIADEIMTGLGRTGLPLACQHADIEPDFLCLSKGLTGGFLPLSAMLTSTAIYDLFYDDYASGKAFLHSHTHSGNALAAAVALETLTILESDGIYTKMPALESQLRERMHHVAAATGKITHIRAIGGIVAADLVPNPAIPRLGYHVFQAALRHGALLRPLGNTLYWLPPLTIDDETLERLENITISALDY